MKNIIVVTLLILIHTGCCAMQQHKHHHHSHISELQNDIESHLAEIRVAERQISDERELTRYNHKKKIAIITLITTLIGGAVTVIVIFTKS